MAADNQGALPSLDGTYPGQKQERRKLISDEVLGIPQGRTKNRASLGKLFLLGILVIVIAFFILGGIFFTKGRNAKRQEAAERERQEQLFRQRNEALENQRIEQQKAELLAKQKAEEEARAKALAEAEAERLAELERQRLAALRNQPAAPAVSAPAPNAAGKPIPAPPAGPTPYERKMSGSVLAHFDNGGTRPATAVPASSPPPGLMPPPGQSAAAPAGGSPYTGDNTPLAARLQPTTLSARAANRLPNLDYLLKKGTQIPCALKTGIDTSLPGFVLCNVINDVYSANGKTLLVDRGASLFGEQQSSLRHGQARTFVVWTRVDNPSGVSAALDSPGVDQMGFSGVPGYVDKHFLERFGGAILLSLIKDVGDYYSNQQNNSYFSNTGDSSEDMAAETLRNTINIPPNLIVNPGTIVHVLVARDVSFEPVFELARGSGK